MPAVEMLCLANSWKHGGRCVAGILDDGSWIRPVSAAGDGGLEASVCRLDSGRAVDALDVVEIALAEPSPLPHQPENWTVADETWKLVGKQYLPYVADAARLLAPPRPPLQRRRLRPPSARSGGRAVARRVQAVGGPSRRRRAASSASAAAALASAARRPAASASWASWRSSASRSHAPAAGS